MEEVFQAYIVLKLFNAIGPNQEYSTDNVATINGTKSNFKEKISVMGANCPWVMHFDARCVLYKNFLASG